MKVIIWGSSGLLGSNIRKVLEENGHTVVDPMIDVLGTSEPWNDVFNFLSNHLDAKLVVNCIAFTDVDGCETKRMLSLMLNTVWPATLGDVCWKLNLKLLHISTDFVFDVWDTKYLIPEYADTNPVNAYGRDKRIAEIDSLDYGAMVVRISWLFGAHYGSSNVRETFLHAPANLNGLDPKDYSWANKTYGTPTYAKHLAEFICDIVEDNFTFKNDVFHFTNRNYRPVTKLVAMQMTLKAAMGLRRVGRITPRSISPDNKSKAIVGHSGASVVAQRPFNSGLSVRKIIDLGFTPPTLQQAIEEFILELDEWKKSSLVTE